MPTGRSRIGYFAWSMNTDGTPRSTSAAPDGEEYYVMALYFAAHRWGSGAGIYNYQGLHTFPDRYTLDGRPLSRRHSPGMLAAAVIEPQ